MPNIPSQTQRQMQGLRTLQESYDVLASNISDAVTILDQSIAAQLNNIIGADPNNESS